MVNGIFDWQPLAANEFTIESCPFLPIVGVAKLEFANRHFSSATVRVSYRGP